MPTSTPGGAISRSALFTHPSSSTRVHSPERPSTRSGADGASVPAGCPSGDRYSTVRRADSTRDGSTGADALAVVSGGLPADPCPVAGATAGARAGVGRAWVVSESGAAVRELATCAIDSRSVFSTQPARVTWIHRPDVPSATLVRRNPWGNFPMSAPAGAGRRLSSGARLQPRASTARGVAPTADAEL